MVAAGSASRFGRPKQYAELAGQRVLDLAVTGARAACHGVVVVVPVADVESMEVAGVDAVVAGGSTRAASVRAGLAAIPMSADAIAVHDAARPLASASVWAAVLAAVAAGADGAIPALPVTDTLKRVVNGVVVETLDRSQLVAVQTPQAFKAAVLRAAHDAGSEATDDAALVEGVGGRVILVPGEWSNLKLTTPGDIDVAATILRARADSGAAR